MWIDTHCHLDAAEFSADRWAVREQARAVGVQQCVWPAVQAADFSRVRELARQAGDAYALGIHPLYTPSAQEADLQQLDSALSQWRDDPHLVAVGEIGLDAWVSALCTPQAWAKQQRFYRAQLQLARRHGLPVLLHVRKSADALLQGARECAALGGVVHAFNGSAVQAKALIQAGFALGFGGGITYSRALNLRRLAQTLPLSALVLETDAPDMPPQWLYVTAQARAQGQTQGRNAPHELPRVGQVLAELRGMPACDLAQATAHNAQRVLPRLAELMRGATVPRTAVLGEH